MTGRPEVGTVIADDEPRVRRALASLLEGTEYVVLAMAEDGDEALEQIAALAPRVVLTDMNMPAGGPEVVARILANHPGTIVVVMSADSSPDLVATTAAAGAAAFWDKLGTTSLLDVLDALLASSD